MMSATVVFLVFTAEWCGPCKQMIRECGEDSDLQFIASEHNPDAVRLYRVKGYPTIVAICDGKEVARKSGYQGRRNLRDWMEKVIDETGSDEKAEAAGKLFAMRDVLGNLSEAFDEIVEAANDHDAPALAFAALMLQESIEVFQSELSNFVMKKLKDSN